MQLMESQILILGLTNTGRPFRPSDWAERLSGVMSTFGTDHRMSYSPYVKPTTVNGIKCVIVDKKLQDIEPRAFSFLMAFARENDLQVQDALEQKRQLSAQHAG